MVNKKYSSWRDKPGKITGLFVSKSRHRGVKNTWCIAAKMLIIIYHDVKTFQTTETYLKVRRRRTHLLDFHLYCFAETEDLYHIKHL